MDKLYKTLLVTSLISYYLFMFLPSTGLQSLTEEEYNILSWARYGALITWPTWLYWVITLSWIPITIGMWFYIPMARRLFILLSILFVVLNPFEGMYVSTGLEAALGQLTAIIDGAIIAISYLTNIGKQYENA